VIKDKAQAFALARWNDFRAFTPGQKAVTLVALVGLIIGGYVLATWKPAVTYAPLYNNLAAADASSIVSKLDSAGITYKLANGGTEIEVPADKVDSTRLTMSAAGLPGSANSGYSLLDKEGVTTSQFKQQVDYQRAVEGELDKTIEAMTGVTSAAVHLAIPQQDVFNDNSTKPTASVMVTTDTGTALTDAQVQTVSNLVSSSVPGLTADNVSISDSNGDVLKAPGGSLGGAVSMDTQNKATLAYNNELTAQLQAMLDKTLGPNHAIVTVNANLDYNQTKSTEKTYVYNKNNPPVSESKTTEVYKGAGAGTGGTLGTTGTTDTTGASTTGNGQYDKTSTTVNNSLGTLETTTNNAPGQVKNLNVSVVLDRSAKNLNVPGISSAVKSFVGYNAPRGDQLSVTAMPFDNSAATLAQKAATAATKAAAAKASQAQMTSWIKQGVLVLLIAALIFGAILFSRRRNPPAAPVNDDVLGLDEPDDRPSEQAAPTRLPNKDISSLATQRRDLMHVAGERPQDVARVLSDWLNTKETDR
jgi:flagellar M-ring protein FliF